MSARQELAVQPKQAHTILFTVYCSLVPVDNINSKCVGGTHYDKCSHGKAVYYFFKALTTAVFNRSP